MNTSTVATDYYAETRDRVAAALPDVGRILNAIANTHPQAQWLTQQRRAIEAARNMLRVLGDGAPEAFAAHTAEALRPTTLGALDAAVQHALGSQAGRSVRVGDLDTASTAVLFVLGRNGVDPDVYRRAVAPLDQAGAEPAHHAAELPDGAPIGQQWDRGCAFRAGYRLATMDEPMDIARAEKMYPGNLDVVRAGYAAARVDQAP